MSKSYKSLVEELEQLERFLAQNKPSLLYYLPLIKLSGLNHLKKSTSTAIAAKSIKSKFTHLWYAFKIQAMRLNENDTLPVQQADFFLLEHGGKRSTKINDRYFNRLLDALSFYLQPHGKVLPAEFVDTVEQWKTSKYQAVLPLLWLTLKVDIIFRLSRWFNKDKQHTTELLELSKIIKDNGWDAIPFDAHKLQQDLIRINLYKRNFIKLLRQISPKAIFSFCYYSKAAFGLTLAAKALNILSVEVQHGSQGGNHPMYSSYKAAHLNKYDLLPDIFWVWSKSAYEYTSTWINPSTPHQVLKGGNPWLTFYKQQFISPKAKEDKLRPTRVLICLQEPEYYHNSFIKDMIYQANPNIEWWLRLHPSYKDLKPTLLKDFSHLSNVKIEGVSEADLYHIFSIVDINITAFSTTCIEALEFETPSIIIHEQGENYFKHYIQKAYFRFANSATECLKHIQKQDFTSPDKEDLQAEYENIERAVKFITHTS